MNVNRSSCKISATTFKKATLLYVGISKEVVSFIRTNKPWGYGVVDSISGYEPLDSGSNPDTLAGLEFLQGIL